MYRCDDESPRPRRVQRGYRCVYLVVADLATMAVAAVVDLAAAECFGRAHGRWIVRFLFFLLPLR